MTQEYMCIYDMFEERSFVFPLPARMTLMYCEHMTVCMCVIGIFMYLCIFQLYLGISMHTGLPLNSTQGVKVYSTLKWRTPVGEIKPVLVIVDISNLIASYWSTLIIEGNIIVFSQKQEAQKRLLKLQSLSFSGTRRNLKFHEDFNANFER